MATARGCFVFCFHDAEVHHEIGAQGVERWYTDAAAREQWVLREEGGASAFSDRIDRRLGSTSHLAASFRADMGAEWPPAATAAAMAKLEALIADGGWRFVGGAYLLGEGFDDVSLSAVLER